MSDPLSIAAGAAGLVSLGLTVCSGLFEYYNVWKDQHSDISAMCESLEGLSSIFELLDEKIRHPLLDRKSVDKVTESIISCAAGIQGLQSKLKKISSAKTGIASRLQRAQYPFQQSTLEKLSRTVSHLRSNLTLATNTLQLDVSITSLHQMNGVHADIKQLIGDFETSNLQITSSLSKVHLDQEEEKSRALSSEERAIIKSLCPLEFLSKQNDTLSRRQEGTGRWFLESFEFRAWVDTSGSVLWCPGIPGAGKTVLASIVIDHLEQSYKGEKIAVAYVYCIHNSPNQTTNIFLGSLLQQLVIQNCTVLTDIKSIYTRHARCGTRPSLSETARLLRSQVEKFDKVFVVVDALDECPQQDQTRSSFLAEIRGLLPKVNLMVTSRNIPSIESMFKHDPCLEIRAQEQDVESFVKSQMVQRDELVDLLEGHDDVRASVSSAVLQKTHGMFLIAALHMDSLAEEDNIRELEESLQRLPEDLDRTYDDALERIKHQDSRKQARAHQVLTLVRCAKRPLFLEEMREALSIRKSDTFLDPRALPKPESLISTCCGLVVVEDKSKAVRLVHYTAEEYFGRKLRDYHNPEAHRYFAGTLLTYLSFTTFASFSRDKMVPRLISTLAKDNKELMSSRDFWDEEAVVANYMGDLLSNNILLQYAAEYWGYHVRNAFASLDHDADACLATANFSNEKTDSSWNLKELVPDFLGRKPNVKCADEVIHHIETKLTFWKHDFHSPTDVTDLHMAASLGIKYFVDYYLKKGADIVARDSKGMTALHKAAKSGHVEVVRVLLDSGAAIDTPDRKGRSALLWAVSKNQVSVLRLLLQRGSNSGSGSVDNCGHSAMSIAATAGHSEMLEFLARNETDNSIRDQLMGDALLNAVLSERGGVVRFLMRGGERWTISKQYSARAMIKAISEGHIGILEILLEAGVDPSSSLSFSRQSPIDVNAQDRAEADIQLLATGGISSWEYDDRQFPLHTAALMVSVPAVTLLLDYGADANARNPKGETAMVVLSKSIGLSLGDVSGYSFRKSVSITQLLLDRGADAAATDCELNRTSLEWAILQGNEALVRLLLQHVKFSAARKDMMQYLTRLYFAIWTSNDGAIKRLLQKKRNLGLESISELLFLCIPAQEGYVGVVLEFLQSGAAIEAKTQHGESALHLAAEKGHLAVIQILLDRSANIDSKTKSGDTPLMCAARGAQVAAAKLLLEHSAQLDNPLVNSDRITAAIMPSIYGRSTTIMKMLLDRGGDANHRDDEAHGGTLLHIVARNQPGGSQTRNIRTLLKYGADIEARDEEGKTPLAAAVEDYTFEAISFLLSRGADLEARDNSGQTPIGTAVRKGAFRAVQFFIGFRADLEAKDNDGHTPLVLAVRNGNIEMVRFLLERGADPQALSSAVKAEGAYVYDNDFIRAVKIVREAQSKGSH